MRGCKCLFFFFMDITGGYQVEEDTGVTAAIREADL